jgi:hypothetical protein
LELAGGDSPYRPPEPNEDYAGLLISLSRQEHPDTAAYADPEIVWRMNKEHHAGLLVKSPSAARVRDLLDSYSQRFERDFYAYLAPKDKPTS